MDRTGHIYQVLRFSLEDRQDIRITPNGNKILIQGFPGSGKEGGPHWQVRFTIDAEAPVLPKPEFLVMSPTSMGSGRWVAPQIKGLEPPADIVEYARNVSIRLRNSTYNLSGLSDLERKALMILRNVVDFSHGEDLPPLLKSAIDDAKELSTKFFEDVTSSEYVDYKDNDPPKLGM